MWGEGVGPEGVEGCYLEVKVCECLGEKEECVCWFLLFLLEYLMCQVREKNSKANKCNVNEGFGQGGLTAANLNLNISVPVIKFLPADSSLPPKSSKVANSTLPKIATSHFPSPCSSPILFFRLSNARAKNTWLSTL